MEIGEISQNEQFQLFPQSFYAICIIKSFNSFSNNNFRLLQTDRIGNFNNFKFDENARKFSNRVENTAEKGEIARKEPFLLFLQGFQKNGTEDT